jgi:DNA ligase-1
MQITRPMKGPQLLDPETNKFFVKVPYPVLGTPKLDGIRCLVVNHRALTDKFEPLPNKWIAYSIAEFCPEGFDGEIITLTGGKRDDFNTTQSKVMHEDGKPSFGYYVFDFYDSTMPYWIRVERLKDYDKDGIGGYKNVGFVSLLLPQPLYEESELRMFEEYCLREGFEGVMLRRPDSPYKCGRSTLKEFYMVKLKRFYDSEAIVVSVNERMHNGGKAFKGKIGQAKRHKFKAEQVGTGLAGSLTVKDCNPESEHFGQTFGCGLRLNNEQKEVLYRQRKKFIGKVLTYKYQRSGQKELPRFPVFYRWRL